MVLQLESFQEWDGRNAEWKWPQGDDGTQSEKIQQKNFRLHIPFTGMQMYSEIT